MSPAERFTPSRPRPQQDRPSYGDRPAFGGAGSGDRPGGPSARPPFSPRPPFAGPQRPADAGPVGGGPSGGRIRLRDGDREVEVHGTPAFIRQTLEDLPQLFARLTGTPAPTPAAISIPASPPRNGVESTFGVTAADADVESAPATPRPARVAVAQDSDELERNVFAVLRRSKRPLKVADIRAQLDGDATGQQVRRILERSDRVTSNSDKPAGYRLR